MFRPVDLLGELLDRGVGAFADFHEVQVYGCPYKMVFALCTCGAAGRHLPSPIHDPKWRGHLTATRRNKPQKDYLATIRKATPEQGSRDGVEDEHTFGPPGALAS